MELQTFFYKSGQGWSISELPGLDSPRTLVLVFGAPQFSDDPAPIQQLKQTYPQAKILGCSTAGEIFGSIINDHSLSVAVMRFTHTDLRLATATVQASSDSFKAGEQIAQQLMQSNLTAIFILSDGLNVNGSELIKGINSIVSANVIVTGGLAGDGDKFKKTWIIQDGKLAAGAVVAAGFYGDKLYVGHGSKGGWDTFGPERHVTKSAGNILYTLDSKPALQLYKEYLGERASGLPATGLLFPLAIRKDKNDNKHLVRTILAVDENNQSMTFAGDIPQGYLAQLMRANFDRLVTGANDAARLANPQINITGPVLCVAISCVGRRLLLGERTEEETESTLEALPDNTQQIGFYSYGEISPYATGSCDLHNQTMTLTLFTELE